MINIVKVKLENKTNKPFIYYLSSGKVTLNPNVPVIFEGDLFSREYRQEGTVEGLLVNVYNGNISMTLICDDTFIHKIEKEKVVNLPKRAQAKLVSPAKSEEVAKEEPKEVAKEVIKEEPKETVDQDKKSNKPKTTEKKAEDKQLKDTVVEDGKAKKQVTKL